MSMRYELLEGLGNEAIDPAQVRDIRVLSHHPRAQIAGLPGDAVKLGLVAAAEDQGRALPGEGQRHGAVMPRLAPGDKSGLFESQ